MTATETPEELRRCHSAGREATSRESLSADLKVLRRPPPSAIIHGRGTPREADDGCLACGSSSLAAAD